jgi:hypothetical protein
MILHLAVCLRLDISRELGKYDFVGHSNPSGVSLLFLYAVWLIQVDLGGFKLQG